MVMAGSSPDRFESAFRGILWTPRGAIPPAIIGAVPALLQFGDTRAPVWLLVSAGCAALAGVWWLGIVRLIDWLRSMHGWPVLLRRMIVLAVAVVTGVFSPALVGGAISSIPGW
jgi:hypothetical protein